LLEVKLPSLKEAEKERSKILTGEVVQEKKSIDLYEKSNSVPSFMTEITPILQELRQLVKAQNLLVKNLWITEDSDKIFIFLSINREKFVVALLNVSTEIWGLYGYPKRIDTNYGRKYIELVMVGQQTSLSGIKHLLITSWPSNAFYYDNTISTSEQDIPLRSGRGGNVLVTDIPLKWDIKLLDKLNIFITQCLSR
jgi:hypothetical protein